MGSSLVSLAMPNRHCNYIQEGFKFLTMKKAETKNQREEQIPASVLIDDLASYDVARRINALKNIRQVVIALGNERTLN